MGQMYFPSNKHFTKTRISHLFACHSNSPTNSFAGLFYHRVQRSPCNCGNSAFSRPLLPCIPKLTVCPGKILPFQLTLLAVYGLVPVKVAFQLLVMAVPSLYVQFTLQPLISVSPTLVKRTSAVKPVFHSFDIT